MITSSNFSKMKLSLSCLILASDFEDHNVLELVQKYRKLDPEPSDYHLNLIVRRGITLALHQGGLPAVREFWFELQVSVNFSF